MENMKEKRQKRWSWKRSTIVITVLAVLFLLWYVNDYYHSDETVQDCMEGNTLVQVKNIEDGLFIDGPGDKNALIFYPGAKVEYTAYLPLLSELAEQGVDSFLIKMPCNLAFLGKNKAGDIMDSYDYSGWYLSGHSLGGAMAAAYAAEHLDNLKGLVLLAAYPTKELKVESFSALSLYGSEDGVLNMEKVEQRRLYMPSDYTEICIDGGNHAQFGNYGAQKGDKAAAISREDQQSQTVEAICKMVEEHENNEEEKSAMEYQQITAEKAKKIMDSGEDIVVLDVRTQEEYDSGHIKEAICLPNETILEEPEELPDKTQKILVYCRSGRRSKQAAQKLADMGYENVLEFGGILDWPYKEMVE